MLRPGQEIDADVVWQRQIAGAVDARVDECRGTAASPILDGRIGVEHLWPLVGRVARLQPIACAGHVGFVGVGEGKLRRGKHVPVPGCRESPVVVAARRAGNVRPDAVEHASILLVGVESFVEELSEEATCLRIPERERRAAAHRQIRAIAEGRGRVANRRQPDAGHHRVSRAIGDPIPAARVEAAVELDAWWRAAVEHPSPTRARNRDRLVPEQIAHRQRVVGAGRIGRGIGGRRANEVVDERRPAHACVHDDVDTQRLDVDSWWNHRPGRLETQPLGRYVEFPAHPHQRVAVPEQQGARRRRASCRGSPPRRAARRCPSPDPWDAARTGPTRSGRGRQALWVRSRGRQFRGCAGLPGRARTRCALRASHRCRRTERVAPGHDAPRRDDDLRDLSQSLGRVKNQAEHQRDRRHVSPRLDSFHEAVRAGKPLPLRSACQLPQLQGR